MPVWERSPSAGKAVRACLTAMSGGPVGDLPQPGHLLEEGVDLVPIRVAVGRHRPSRDGCGADAISERKHRCRHHRHQWPLAMRNRWSNVEPIRPPVGVPREYALKSRRRAIGLLPSLGLRLGIEHSALSIDAFFNTLLEHLSDRKVHAHAVPSILVAERERDIEAQRCQRRANA
jgi:hypothetical protein